MEAVRGDLEQYRGRAVGMLRKYLRMSIEIGRLPSLLGRELFRAKCTSYNTNSFEDAVIFVHDMERVLESLDATEQVIIARVFFQEYTYDEAAKQLQLPRRSFVRSMAAALDSLTRVLLRRGLMEITHDPISAHEVKQQQRLENSDKTQPVSVSFFMNLRYPKFCQARKIAKVQIS
jgi:predicted DNA-binding protein (UPF0251 family)